MLKLVALGGAEDRPEFVQAIVLRWQHLAQELVTFIGQLQMQAAAIVVAFTALNPAALFEFIGNTGRIGTGGAQRAAQFGRLNAVIFLRLQRNQRHKQRLVNPLSFQHFITVFQ